MILSCSLFWLLTLWFSTPNLFYGFFNLIGPESSVCNQMCLSVITISESFILKVKLGLL